MGMEMKFCGECGASMTVKPAPAPVSPIFSPPVPQPAQYTAPVQPVSGRSCRSCGNSIKPGDKFCSKCCAIVKDETVPVAVSVAAPRLLIRKNSAASVGHRLLSVLLSLIPHSNLKNDSAVVVGRLSVKPQNSAMYAAQRLVHLPNPLPARARMRLSPRPEPGVQKK